MIEDILEQFTPFLIRGKKLYSEEDVKKMLVSVIQKSWCLDNNKKQVHIEQYPEVSC
jgi:hypothetical protein